MAARYLITGGAGYVGSHCVKALLERGAECVVYDNLITGHASAVLSPAKLIVGDLADTAKLNAVLADGPWDGVFHFAALSVVGESMQNPCLYFSENTGNGIKLIEACITHSVKRFVLSSTAAVFGEPKTVPISDDAPVDPYSPYGESKYMLERVLYWADQVHGLRSACLRYFNAAGADPDGMLGEDHRPETHLLPLIIDAALGRRQGFRVFGTDYPTRDGTCIRDYVHVCDLADAHLRVMDLIDTHSAVYNLGTGRGHSVMEIIETVKRVSGLEVPVSFAERRPGDPPALVADSSKFMRATGWMPRFRRIDDLVETTFNWRVAHPDGYGG